MCANHQPTNEISYFLGHASTIWERLQYCAPLTPQSVSEQQTRIRNWSKIVADGDLDQLRLRLQYDSLTIEQVLPYLSTCQWKSDAPIPNWAKAISKWLFQIPVTDRHLIQSTKYHRSEASYPFEELLIPMVLLAERELSNLAPNGFQLLGENARVELLRNLVYELSKLSSQCFEAEFNKFAVRRGQLGLARIISSTRTVEPNRYYNLFVDEHLATRLQPFFRTYPVLARIIATSIDEWLGSQLEMLRRLEQDIEELRSSPEVNIETIQLGLSDRHVRYDRVGFVKFSDGATWVYKPKPLEMESSVLSLIDNCNRKLGLKQPRKFRMLKRPHYGWAQMVKFEPLRSESQIPDFFRSTGALTCLMFILNGSDLHSENVILNGGALVPVDAETIFQPIPRDVFKVSPGLAAFNRANSYLRKSVLRTGILPSWSVDRISKIAFDMSALGGIGSIKIPGKSLAWRYLNTDQLASNLKQATLQPADNSTDGLISHESITSNVDKICEGFEATYKLAAKDEDFQNLISNLVEDQNASSVRFIFRPTQNYAWILYQALAPSNLSDGVDFSIELDVLSKPLLRAPEKPIWWSIIRSEGEFLERGAIPAFQVKMDELDLNCTHNSKVIDSAFVLSPMDEARKRMKDLSEFELAKQLGLIRSAVDSLIRPHDLRAAAAGKVALTKSTLVVHSAELIERSIKIGDALIEASFEGSDGSRCWIGLGYSAQAQRFVPQAFAETMYSGCSGVGLFLLELGTLTRERRFLEAGQGALMCTDALANNPAQKSLSNRLSLGGINGIGSIIFVLSRAAQLLQQRDLADRALQIARNIDWNEFKIRQEYDLLDGVAGLVAALVHLHKIHRRNEVVDLIQRWTGVLVPYVQYDKEKDLPCQGLCGMSHGAVGLAYSLSLISIVEGQTRDAIEQLLEFESSRYSREHSGWPDLRVSEQGGNASFNYSWCNGAAGGVMARVLNPDFTKDCEMFSQEIQPALERLRTADLLDCDHLCCGNSGIISCLSACERKLPGRGYKEAAWRIAGQMIARANCLGGFSLSNGVRSSLYSPGLFQGIAGIGLTMLQLAYPYRVCMPSAVDSD